MGTGHSHDHSNAHAPALAKALALTGTFLVIEVISGLLTGSLALISDAAHMLTDTAGLAIALIAVKIGERPADNRRTFGYRRFEVLAAAFNALLLFGVAGYILFEAWRRLQNPTEIDSLPMLAVAVAGLVVNLVAMRLLVSGKDTSVNVKGAYLEVWSDMLGSLGVIIAAVLIWFTDWRWIDPLVAVAIALWVLPRTWRLLSDTLNVLLEGVPEGINLDELKRALRALPGVEDVHDLHVWAMSSEPASLSAHLVVVPGGTADAIRAAAAELLREKYGITHVTLQAEATDCRLARADHGLHA